MRLVKLENLIRTTGTIYFPTITRVKRAAPKLSDMQLFAVVSLSIKIKTPLERQRKHQTSPPSLPHLRRLSITSLSQKWGKSITVNWKCKLAAVREEHLWVYPEHVSQADYSHGTVFGEEAQQLRLRCGWLLSQRWWIIKRNDAPDVSPVFVTNVLLDRAGRGA